MSKIFPPAGRVNRTIWAPVHWQPKCWAKRWRIWRQRINKIQASSERKDFRIDLRPTTNSHTQADVCYLVFIHREIQLQSVTEVVWQRRETLTQSAWKLLLNKLKAGCFLEHRAESAATHLLPSCIMHTNMLFLCSARWIIAPSYCSSGFGLRWRDVWGKADSLSGLRYTPSHQADTVELSGKRLTEGIWTGSEAHLGSASCDLAAGKHVKTYSSFNNSHWLLNF